jgi:cellulose synthase/poly-beta-1,6-N-acetylglucosamine synthase-like glycosyltransferase
MTPRLGNAKWKEDGPLLLKLTALATLASPSLGLSKIGLSTCGMREHSLDPSSGQTFRVFQIEHLTDWGSLLLKFMRQLLKLIFPEQFLCFRMLVWLYFHFWALSIWPVEYVLWGEILLLLNALSFATLPLPFLVTISVLELVQKRSNVIFLGKENVYEFDGTVVVKGRWSVELYKIF